MVSFDSRQPGTPAAAWRDARLQFAPELTLTDLDELLVFAAHPDDETLGAAGLIRDFARRHLPIHVVVVTDGAESGHNELAAIRSAELTETMAQLAPDARVTELGFTDSSTPDDREEIGERIAEIIASAAENALVVAPWSGDGHRDHRVVGELVESLAIEHRRLAYPIWMWHWADPSDASLPWARFRALRVDGQAKSRAIDGYRSQLEGDEPVLHAAMLEHFRGDREIFIDLDAELDTDTEPQLPASYFETLHRTREDPWRFLTRWYEERKRGVTTSALLRKRYPSALEIGCSIGVLTSELTERCDELLAVDVSESAVARARERLGPRARIEVADVAAQFPDGPFDLIVLSEVGYYFDSEQLDSVLLAARSALAPGGELLACHWRHPVDDYPLAGDEVHRRIAAMGMPRLVRHEEEDFVLEVYSEDSRSVATREGLA